jgi:hypothetical protein
LLDIDGTPQQLNAMVRELQAALVARATDSDGT